MNMNMNTCSVCGEPASLTCARCKAVCYCAPACQSRDWSKHKGVCVAALVVDGSAAAAVSSTTATTTASLAAEEISLETPAFGLCAADCGKPAILRCSGCLGTFYCGKECQKREWKQHKEQCKKAAGIIASMKCESIDDLDMTFASYKREAKAGHAVAQCALGVCYYHGSGVAVDKAEAFKWFKRAAEAGFAAAQYNLGVCYSNGSGVAVDKAEAANWWKRAADAGDADALKMLQSTK